MHVGDLGVVGVSGVAHVHRATQQGCGAVVALEPILEPRVTVLSHSCHVGHRGLTPWWRLGVNWTGFGFFGSSHPPSLRGWVRALTSAPEREWLHGSLQKTGPLKQTRAACRPGALMTCGNGRCNHESRLRSRIRRQENRRLQDQANVLVDLLHAGTRYEKGSRVLEVGCGVGAQTVTLARNSPNALFTCIDVSAESIVKARQAVDSAGVENVHFMQGDIFTSPFAPASFDHVFVCHVLEHLSEPSQVLCILKNLIKIGGTITVIEGDHSSAYFYPRSHAADLAIQCQVELLKTRRWQCVDRKRALPTVDPDRVRVGQC